MTNEQLKLKSLIATHLIKVNCKIIDISFINLTHLIKTNFQDLTIYLATKQHLLKYNNTEYTFKNAEQLNKLLINILQINKEFTC